MNPTARRLIGAAAVAVARKLLPEAVTDNLGSALALRSDATLAPLDRANSFPTTRPQILYAPPPMPVQPMAAPAPPPRRRRKVVTETIMYEETEW